MNKYGPYGIFFDVVTDVQKLDSGAIDSDTNLTSSHPSSFDYN